MEEFIILHYAILFHRTTAASLPVKIIQTTAFMTYKGSLTAGRCCV
jgi:hypothetical protein